MSYDILIFEPDAVTDEDFPQWWEQVSRWEEPRDYDTTEGSTPAIRAFYATSSGPSLRSTVPTR